MMSSQESIQKIALLEENQYSGVLVFLIVGSFHFQRWMPIQFPALLGILT